MTVVHFKLKTTIGFCHFVLLLLLLYIFFSIFFVMFKQQVILSRSIYILALCGLVSPVPWCHWHASIMSVWLGQAFCLSSHYHLFYICLTGTTTSSVPQQTMCHHHIDPSHIKYLQTNKKAKSLGDAAIFKRLNIQDYVFPHIYF